MRQLWILLLTVFVATPALAQDELQRGVPDSQRNGPQADEFLNAGPAPDAGAGATRETGTVGLRPMRAQEYSDDTVMDPPGQTPAENPSIFIMPRSDIGVLSRASDLDHLDAVVLEVLRGEAALFGAPMGFLVPIGSALRLSFAEIPEKDALNARGQALRESRALVPGAIIGLDVVALEGLVAVDPILGGMQPLDPDLLTLEDDRFLSDQERRTGEVELAIGAGLLAVGHLRQAEDQLWRCYNLRRKTRGAADSQTLEALETLVRFYESAGLDEVAARVFRSGSR